MTHTEYIYIGDVDIMEQLDNLIAQNLLDPECLVVLVYKNFSFTDSTTSASFKDVPLEEIKQVVQIVHSYGAKIELLFGGIKYPFFAPGQYETPEELANKVNSLVIECDFDGAIFEMLQVRSTSPSDFSNAVGAFLNALIAINPTLPISSITNLI